LAFAHAYTLPWTLLRAVPMAPDVGSALAQLGRRELWTGEDNVVFAGDAGLYLDGSQRATLVRMDR
jgi:hypothetical protein